MAVTATGFFDGVHLGHRQVINTLVQTARERGEESVVVTFSQHPRAVLQQDPVKLRLLTSRGEKTELLKSMGVDRVEVLPFTREFALMTAEEYIRKVLIGMIGTTVIVLGYDNRFGSDNLPQDEIAGLAEKCHIGTKLVSAISGGVEAISSTKIRALLEGGQVSEAASMLGRPYCLHGVVVSGKQLGRTIGFPTANLCVSDPLKQIPAKGVYSTMSEIMGKEYLGMTNVGDIVETNIFDFNEDVYSLEMKVHFISRIRNMRSFSSLEQLAVQLREDKQYILQSVE